jgi:hypothetical protein
MGSPAPRHIAPFLRLFVPNSLTVYHPFEDCLSAFSALWIGVPCGGHFSTAITAPFLSALVPSSSLVGCQPVQVYYQHPLSRVLLDPVDHIIHPGEYLIWAFPRGSKLGRFPLRAGWAIEPHPVPLVVPPRSWLVYRTESSCDHWPALGVGGHSRGCRVGGLVILPHDRLWVVPCLGVPQTAGRRVVEVLARTLGGLELCP